MVLALTARTRAAVAAALAALVAGAGTAAADAYLRVISQKAPIHTGPAPSYREVYVAERGEVFPVLTRAGDGYWFRVELEDGTTGWVFGELVFPFEVREDENPGVLRRMGRAIRRAILAPSPVPFSSVELSFSAGVIDREGSFLFRPAWLIDSYFAVEGFAGLSPRQDDDLLLAGLGWTLRLMPGSALGPFINAGVGAAHLRPKSDNFTEEADTLMALAAGGGFEITFKKQITVRLDYRNWTIFDPDKASNGQELSGGLAIFF
jgi:opacity protein-like surface antigen